MNPPVTRPGRHHPTVALGLCVALLAACASTPPPNDALAAAEAAIRRADAARVGDLVAPELTNARTKLAGARDAVSRKDMTEAARLAQQARLDADFAAAKANALKARDQANALLQGNEALRQELLRSSISAPPVPVPSIPVSSDAPAN